MNDINIHVYTLQNIRQHKTWSPIVTPVPQNVCNKSWSFFVASETEKEVTTPDFSNSDLHVVVILLT